MYKGDERPCQRCIKRGLQDACQDGVRKKAKYLHDAPNEALMPGVGGNLFNHAAALRNSFVMQNAEIPQQQQTPFFRSPQQFNAFPVGVSMPPPMMQDNSMNVSAFGQQSPIPSTFDMPGQHPMQTPTLNQPPPNLTQGMSSGWNGALFDPSDPALFNFDLAGMNFDNRYGAAEFGMLGHMATGADATPPSDTGTQRGSVGQNGSNQYPIPMGSFSESPDTQRAFGYNDTPMPDWSTGPNLYGQQFPRAADAPHAFAIETSTGQFTSPDAASSPPGLLKFEESPTMISTAYISPPITSNPMNNPPQPSSNRPSVARQPSHISTSQLKAKSQLPVKSTKRPRDPSSIYTSVTSPYSYTAGFHSLIAYLQRRFAAHPSKTLTIAKSLASIRPSFIATTKTLNRDDLIFMEKCFQRTLWEYEGFIEGVGTPTIVARRTGEIAAVGKEFSILTGWKKDVLLGREPNLNINRGGNSGSTSAGPGSGANTTGRVTGVNTPTLRAMGGNVDSETGEKRLQPVFLAELLDDESVVEFYEGFARLAFGDSRGSVMGKGKLLKYRTKDDEIALNLKLEADQNVPAVIDSKVSGFESKTLNTTGSAVGGARSDTAKTAGAAAADHRANMKRMSSGIAKRTGELKKEGIAGESSMQKLGFKDGKVECTYCWTVKRDVFDIPMLIVMNVSVSFRLSGCLPMSYVAPSGRVPSAHKGVIANERPMSQFLPCI